MHKIRSSGISVNKPKSFLNLNEFILNFLRGLDGGSYFSKDQGLNRKRTEILLNWIGWGVDFEKHQGLLCKMCGPGAVACVSANAGADIIDTWHAVAGSVHHCAHGPARLVLWAGSRAQPVDRLHTRRGII
jgi:hypothetical protein